VKPAIQAVDLGAIRLEQPADRLASLDFKSHVVFAHDDQAPLPRGGEPLDDRMIHASIAEAVPAYGEIV
jgi:hypothetical protein